MSKEMMKEIATEGAKAAPPVAVVTADIAHGWSMNDTVLTLTIVYLVLQIGWLLWRWYRAANGQAVKAEP